MAGSLAVPIGCVRFDLDHAFPAEVCDVFRSHGVWIPLLDSPRFGTAFLPKRGLSGEDEILIEGERSEIQEELKGAIPDPEKRATFLALLSECDWTVTFLIASR